MTDKQEAQALALYAWITNAVCLSLISFKIMGVIDWSWPLVLLPIWGPALGAITIVLALCAIKAVDVHDVK